VREDVVGDDQGSSLELRPRELEEPLVVSLLGIDEDQIENVIDLGRVVLEGEHPPAEMADAGSQPDRGIAARSPDFEHLAVRLWRDEREEELPRRAFHCTRAL
jgi:hypothetical protein